jgi:hypothetical protein
MTDPNKQAKALRKINDKAQPPARKSTAPRPGHRAKRFTPKRQEEYLSVLQEKGEPALARQEVGIGVKTVSELRRKEPEFGAREDEAMRIYRASVAAEIHRRGIEGVQEPIFWNGTIVGWITKYSDRMLELHAKRHIPEYRDHQVVEQKVTGAVEIMGDLRRVPPPLRKELRQLLEKVSKYVDKDDADSSE